MTRETWLDRMIAEQQALRRVNGKPVEILKFIPITAQGASPSALEAACSDLQLEQAAISFADWFA
jgi:hypothetical protein